MLFVQQHPQNFDKTLEAYKELSGILMLQSSFNMKINYQYNLEKCDAICSFLTTKLGHRADTS